jgi:hypothetical protein
MRPPGDAADATERKYKGVAIAEQRDDCKA